MKFNLLVKYLLVYAVVALLGFFTVTFFIYRVDYHQLSSHYSDSLYRQAISIANEYAPDYFSSDRMRIIENELKTIAALGNNRIMFIDPSGNIMLDTDSKQSVKGQEFLYTIDEFDYASLGTGHSQTGDFYGLFDEPVLSVYAPITNSFTTKGYVIIHMKDSIIRNNVYVTYNTNYLTLLIIMIFNLLFIALYIIHIHNPLTAIIKATNEYGKGNLSYKTSVSNNNDEIGRLAVSLNYMASKLAESDQFQQKFLSNISHDFRSPLTSIKGYLEAISDGTIPPEMQKKYIDIVLFETERLTKLTSNILSLNELDPKTVRLEITTFDINSIIKHTIETFEGTCKKKNIQFQLTFSGEIEYVKGDKSKIGQIIYNLVDNAIKFSNDNSCIYIIVREKGEKAYISVKDTGVGISKESIDKVWDRFYKSDSSRGRDKKGSGLGLSITKEIIQAHNEHINVISTPGVGTEFTFTLPIDKSAVH